jgi:hypothetical protein
MGCLMHGGGSSASTRERLSDTKIPACADVFDSHGHENLGCVLLDEGWMGILCFFGTEPIQADLFIFLFGWLNLSGM